MSRDENVKYECWDKRFLDTTTRYSSSEFGTISWAVEVRAVQQGTANKFQRGYFDAELRITDCYKVVTLSLTGDTAKDIEARMVKIRNFHDSIKLLLTQLEVAHEAMLKLEATENPNYEAP